MLYNSPYITEPVGMTHGTTDASAVIEIARASGRMDDPSVRDLVGEARMLEIVSTELPKRISESIRTGHRSDQAAAIGRLFKGTAVARMITLALEAAGQDAAAWTDDDASSMAAVNFLMRQAGSIGGGTVEMARNVISERVLTMPRERTLDRDVPFRDVPRSRRRREHRRPSDGTRRRAARGAS